MSHVISLFMVTGFLATVLLTGYVVLGFARWRSGEHDLLDVVCASSVLGMAVGTLVGLFLAYLGVFSALLFELSLLLLAAVLVVRQKFVLPRPSSKLGVAAPSAILVAFVLLAYGVVYRSQEVTATRDPGVYVASGMELSRTGKFGWTDPLAARFGFPAVSHLFEDIGDILDGKPRYLRFSGFYVTDPPRGIIAPQFLHGYEVWLGAIYAMAGPQAALCVNPFVAALALLAIFCALRLVAGSSTALLSVCVLALNPMQLWFARFPGTEMLFQALAWGTLFLYLDCLRTNAQATRRMVLALLPLTVACMIKFAAWILLPVFAFDLACRRSRGILSLRARTIWLLLPAIVVLIWLHAAIFAPFYLYGSLVVGARKQGIDVAFVPVLYLGSVLAMLSLGSIVGPAIDSLAGRVSRRTALRAGSGLLLTILAVWLCQFVMLRFGSGRRSIWDENTNLLEFSQYFGFPVFAMGIAGLMLAFAGDRMRWKSLMFCLVGVSAMLIVHRNLEASHPWGARRWVPVLLPLFCFGIAYFVIWMWRRRFIAARALAVVAACVAFFVPGYLAKDLVRTKSYRGVVPALDQLGVHLDKGDLVLVDPTWTVAQWAPYLHARLGVDAYVQPRTEEAWLATKALVTSAGQERRRIIFMTDQPVIAAIHRKEFMRQIAEVPFNYEWLPDAERKVPTKLRSNHTEVQLLQLDLAGAPADWWPFASAYPKLARSPLPLSLGMGIEATPHLQHFMDPTQEPGAAPFRWTDGVGVVRIGDLLQFPITKPRLRVTVRVSSRRVDRREPVIVECYIDQKRTGTLVGGLAAGPNWSDESFEIDSSLLTPDSVLRLRSMRHRIGRTVPAGKLGVAVESIRVE